MKFLATAHTDIGNVKKTNQDSAFVKIVDTSEHGEIAFAAVCDGMGGLEKGEIASSNAVRMLMDWFESFSSRGYIKSSLNEIGAELTRLIKEENSKISDYGSRYDVTLGTTLTALLLIKNEYLIVHVGDSRVYQITNAVEQLTEDQTFIAREIKRGTMTPEQAKTDPRRNMLLQCVGASKNVVPELVTGKVTEDSVFMICSDGFRHVISSDEMYESFNYRTLCNKEAMDTNAQYLIDTVKSRNERDNITVVLIKCM